MSCGEKFSNDVEVESFKELSEDYILWTETIETIGEKIYHTLRDGNADNKLLSLHSVTPECYEELKKHSIEWDAKIEFK